MDHEKRHPLPIAARDCLFCGSDKIVLEERYVHRSGGRASAFYVNCDGCRANGPWEIAVAAGEVPQALFVAVERWNEAAVKKTDRSPYNAVFPPSSHPRYLDALVALELGYWDVGIFEGHLVHGDNTMNGWPQRTPEFVKLLKGAHHVNING